MCRLLSKALLALSCLIYAGTSMAIEEAEYTVLLQDGDFEVREYAAHIIAETVVDSEFEEAGSDAFRRLFRYISGNNQAHQEIAMTAPVGQQPAGQEIAMTAPVGQTQTPDGWAISFMMPASFTMDTLPKPKDPRVVLRKVAPRTMAAIRYSGFWSSSRYETHKAKLDAWLAQKGYTVVGAPLWARYDAPFMPWFLRRNEVLIPIAVPQ